ncbi:uncharacterized protein [Drosophila tropicalis]|uniref:uncharacterized protein n=1 Tax=Drosophila tropicalis TaxID=46794 RepID=UPI0035AC0707
MSQVRVVPVDLSSSTSLTDPKDSINSNYDNRSQSAQYSVGSISNDEPRIIWLKTIIANCLGVFEPEHVNTLIAKNEQAVNTFFRKRYERQADLDCVVMFVWRTFYDKLVEEEITVLEEVPRPPPPVVDKKAKGKKGKGDGKAGGKASAKAAGGPKGRKKGGQESALETDSGRPSGTELEVTDPDATYTGGETTDADLEGELEGEEETTVAGSGKSSARSKRSPASSDTENGRKTKKKNIYVPVYVEVKKLVPAYVKTPLLHCHFGEMQPANLDPKIRYVYIVRKNRREIPWFNEIAQCFAEMPLLFVLGTIRGSLIDSLREDLNVVYRSAYQFQFREPATTDTQQMDSYDGQAGGDGGVDSAAGDAGEDVSSEAKESGPGLLELSKPSEFRLKALKQQKKFLFLIGFHAAINGGATIAVVVGGGSVGASPVVFWPFSICLAAQHLWHILATAASHSS